MNSYRKYGFRVAYGEKLIIVFCSSLPLFSLTSPSSVSHHPCKKFQHPAVYKSQVSHVWRHGASGFCLISCPGTVLLPTPPSRGGLQRTWSAGSTEGLPGGGTWSSCSDWQQRLLLHLPPRHQPGRAVAITSPTGGLCLTSTKAGRRKRLRIIKVWPSRTA